jgi:hypothetical protein
MEGLVRYIRVDRIRPNLRLCYSREEVEDLCKAACFQNEYEPIMVFFDGEYFRIIDGEKRWRASRRLGVTFLKAMIVELDYTL